MTMGTLLFWIAAFSCTFTVINAQSQSGVPRITDYSALNNRYLSESIPVGDTLGTIIAVDPDNTKLTYFLQGDGGEYFTIDPDTGVVTLKKSLDFETDTEIKSLIVVIDATNQRAEIDTTLFINDENDNEPEFDDTSISVVIPESEPVGTVISTIRVDDLDTSNAIITLTCSGDSDLFRDACDKFSLRQTGESNKFWEGEVLIAKALDFETRISYAILLLANDGLFNVTNEVHVELEDINDSPPRFIQANPSIIDEELANGTEFQQVIAVDTDQTNPRSIYYEVIEGPNDNSGHEEFMIDSATGMLAVKTRLDYDNVNFPKNIPYEVAIKAREIYPNGTLGDDPSTTATTIVKVTVVDINDNTPTFDQTNYVASVQENILSGVNVPGLQMTITDIDSGTFNSFELVSLDYTDVFQIIPSVDAASSSATLTVIDGRKIDFEQGLREYVVKVEARQNLVPNPVRTGTATVTITVTDVNDVTPEFSQDSYTVAVSELSPEDTFIIEIDATDPEENNFGTAGIRYSLYGNIPEHFAIDPVTGVVTVAPCAGGNPGEDPCIDYESKKSYSLSVTATDEEGSEDGRSRSVPLIINILDENDNVPSIETTYTRSIYEEQTVTINPLRIDPVDPDTVGGPLSFSLFGPDVAYWKVTTETDPNTGLQYGNITANRPVYYDDPVNKPVFELVIEVEDQNFKSQANVFITVIDINTFAPEFELPIYFESIPEDFPGDTYVTTVTANDRDDPSTGNGQLDISISSGDRGKFYARTTSFISEQEGYKADIYTTASATFNFDTESEYVMELLVRDQGAPEVKSGTSTLTVTITDINNKNPVILPTYDTVTISENTAVGVAVHTVTATDADDNAKLEYSFIASAAYDSNGAEVDISVYDFGALFRMDGGTGVVYVDSPLDRDRTARILFDLTVKDTAAVDEQIGTGVLQIYITEYNDQAPQFDQLNYRFSINEELNINSFIENLYCTDADDKIERYELVQEVPSRPEYLSFYAASGSIVVEDRIDYDPPGNLRQIQLTAYCWDTGTPQLSGTAQVIVDVVNINDNQPIFANELYRATVPEGTVGGLLPLDYDIIATDIDADDYGEVRYSIVNEASNPNPFADYFTIDNLTAVITIKDTTVFDREVTPFMDIEVKAYDSPLDSSVRKSSVVSVYITISDINDNCPIFGAPGYNVTVPESTEPGTSIIDTMATDADEGQNADIRYSIEAGSGVPADAETLFTVGVTNGRVEVNNPLKDKSGLYSFTLVATDKMGVNSSDGGYACATHIPIFVEVRESLNNAPEWIRPPTRDFLIYVLESQYEGMLVYSAKAVDTDVGENGVVDYYFLNGEDRVQNTPEFRINRVTGVIRAEVIFDREQQDTYFLTLLAQDRGIPAATSETTLTVVILDVDDNDPVFPTKNGLVEPLYLPADDNVIILDDDPVTDRIHLGKCSATDADSDHENNEIFYDILAAEEDVRASIQVDRQTCDIYLLNAVNYEDHPSLEFDILAYNEKNDDTVIRYRRRRAANPSIQHVIVEISDQNDNVPVFTSSQYFGCISFDTPFNQTILEVSATDVDEGDNSRLRYSLASTNQGFAIDSVVGYLYNIKTFRDEQGDVFRMGVSTTDGTFTANSEAIVFITSPSNTVRLKVNRPLNEVQPYSQQLVNTLNSAENTGVVYACIDEMRNHINDDDEEILTATDVFFAAIREDGNGGYEVIPAEELVDIINTELEDENSAYSTLYITEVEVEGDDDGFTLTEDAVLAILIICILLIVLALVLFCVACYCIQKKDRKKKKKIRAERHNVVTTQQEPVETSFNPVYDNMADPEYSTVQKVKPISTPIAPVIIPAPENLQPLDSEEPPRQLQPVEDPVPVIETEILPPQQEPLEEPPLHNDPELEDRIETVVEDEPLQAPELPPPPPELDDETIEAVIVDSLDDYATQ